MAQQGIRKIIQTLPNPRNVTQARYRDDKIGIAYIQRVWPNKVQEM